MFSSFILFWLCWVLVAARTLVVVSGSCSLVAMHRLLTVMPSLVAEHSCRHLGSAVVACKLQLLWRTALVARGMWNLQRSGMEP